MASCKLCGQEFENPKQLGPHHQLFHGKPRVNHVGIVSQRVAVYDEDPNHCRFCELPLSYTDRHKEFCNRSCFARFNTGRRQTTQVHVCPQCGKDARNKFCSNSCQKQFQATELLRNWLSSGELPGSGVRDGEGHLHRLTDRHTAPRNKYVRNYLLDRQDQTCALCKREFKWEGKLLPSTLDHIDGNAFNNHETNLRLVCPNCNAQLPTTKGANRGNGRRVRFLRAATYY